MSCQCHGATRPWWGYGVVTVAVIQVIQYRLGFKLFGPLPFFLSRTKILTLILVPYLFRPSSSPQRPDSLQYRDTVDQHWQLGPGIMISTMGAETCQSSCVNGRHLSWSVIWYNNISYFSHLLELVEIQKKLLLSYLGTAGVSRRRCQWFTFATNYYIANGGNIVTISQSRN